MAFLTKEELKTKAPVDIINLIVNSDDSTVNNIINENIDAMKSYIFKYYDTDKIFNAEGINRSMVVLKHLKSLVIADVYDIRKNEIPPSTEKKYDEAMRWLEKVGKGDIQPDLPPKEEDNDGDGKNDATFLKLGSRKGYSNRL